MQYQFTTAINCGARSFKPGDVVRDVEIIDYLASLVRLRQVMEFFEPEPAPVSLANSKPPELKTAATKTTAKK